MGKNIFFTILGLFALVGLLGGIKAVQIKDLMAAASTMMPPPPSVSTVDIEQQEWEVALNSVGSLQAVQGVVVSADLSGRVEEIFFTPGTWVKKGQPLVQQDISSEKAQLRAAQANVELAQANLDRAKELRNKRVNSESDLDTAQARYKEAVAKADDIQASIRKKTIVAPFAGKLGIRLVNIGQDLPSGTKIVSLQAVNPMFVNFSLSQQHLKELSLGLEVRVISDAVKASKSFVGKITAIDPEVDSKTRAIKVQATIANPDEALLPGMFVNVEVILPEKDSVLPVPSTAVAYATFGDSVYVVEEETNEETGEKQLIAKQHFVRLGRRQGDYVSIEKGLEPGQTVVSAGIFKLRNGSPVTVNNEVMPEYKLNPKPSDN